MIGCKEAIEDLKLAHRKVGNSNSCEYASIIYGRCGHTEEDAKNAFNLQPIDINWRSTSRLAFRLYENNQKEEMYLLIDGIVDAIDFPAPLLALIDYDKLISGEEKLAKDYLLRAKKLGCTKKALGQVIYVKNLHEKALSSLDELDSLFLRQI